MTVVTRQDGLDAAQTLRVRKAAVGGTEAASGDRSPAERSPWERPDDFPRKSMRTLFVPLALLALALLIWVGFQAMQLTLERQRLVASLASQEGLVVNSRKLRASLDSLATETAKLAEQGNPNARLLVEQLRQRGVTIDTQASK